MGADKDKGRSSKAFWLMMAVTQTFRYRRGPIVEYA